MGTLPVPFPDALAAELARALAPAVDNPNETPELAAAVSKTLAGQATTGVEKQLIGVAFCKQEAKRRLIDLRSQQAGLSARQQPDTDAW
jgi:hypothetical protein